MRIYFKKEQKNKYRKTEALLLAIALGVIAASFILKTNKNESVVLPNGTTLPGIGIFHHLTGYPSPSCGLTRSFISTASLSLTKAFYFHFLGPLLFAGVLLAIAYLLYRVLGGKRKITVDWTKKEMHLFLAVTIVIILGAWIGKLYFGFF